MQIVVTKKSTCLAALAIIPLLLLTASNAAFAQQKKGLVIVG
jgi:hypothetical protein